MTCSSVSVRSFRLYCLLCYYGYTYKCNIVTPQTSLIQSFYNLICIGNNKMYKHLQGDQDFVLQVISHYKVRKYIKNKL